MKSVVILCALLLGVLLCGLVAFPEVLPQPAPEWTQAIEAPREALVAEPALNVRDEAASAPRVAESHRGVPPGWDFALLGSLLAQGREYEALRLESEWLASGDGPRRALDRLTSGVVLEELEAYGCVRLVASGVARDPAELDPVLDALDSMAPCSAQDLAQALAGLRHAPGGGPLLDWSRIPRLLAGLRQRPQLAERLQPLFVHLGESAAVRAQWPLLFEIANDPGLPATLVESARMALCAHDPETYGPIFGLKAPE